MLEVLATLQAALGHGSYGVNALLPTVPLIGGHAAPPSVAQIITDDADATLAFGDKAETWPALVLLDEDNGTWEGEVATHVRDGEVQVTVLYVARDPRAALTYRNSSYTRRAVMLSVRQWLDNTSYAARTLNSLFVITATGLRRRPPGEMIRGIPHAGGLTWTFRVRDLAP